MLERAHILVSTVTRSHPHIVQSCSLLAMGDTDVSGNLCATILTCHLSLSHFLDGRKVMKSFSVVMSVTELNSTYTHCSYTFSQLFIPPSPGIYTGMVGTQSLCCLMIALMIALK
eukprot:scpid109806/ scgid29269/ 